MLKTTLFQDEAFSRNTKNTTSFWTFESVAEPFIVEEVEAAAFLGWVVVAAEEDRVEPRDLEEAASIPEEAWEVGAFHRRTMEAPESVQRELQAVVGHHSEAQIAHLEDADHQNLQNQEVAVPACLEED